MKLRNTLIALLLGVAVGCAESPKVHNSPNSIQPLKTIQQKAVSYKLEDLCDTEIKERNLTLNVYIEPSEVLWDYYKYKDEIFGYVSEFFKQQKINCNIVYHNNGFQKFRLSNELGLEIVSSNVNMKKRREQLLKGLKIKPEFEPRIMYGKGYGLTRAGIALVNGGWEEFRDLIREGEMTIEEADSQFEESYKGMTKKEYMLKQNSALIVHELLHCLGLFHPQTFNPPILTKNDFIPNIMENEPPMFEKQFQEKYPLGYKMTDLQVRLMHSFVARGNTYLAFVDSGRNLEVYLQNIAKENGLGLSK